MSRDKTVKQTTYKLSRCLCKAPSQSLGISDRELLPITAVCLQTTSSHTGNHLSMTLPLCTVLLLRVLKPGTQLPSLLFSGAHAYPVSPRKIYLWSSCPAWLPSSDLSNIPGTAGHSAGQEDPPSIWTLYLHECSQGEGRIALRPQASPAPEDPRGPQGTPEDPGECV